MSFEIKSKEISPLYIYLYILFISLVVVTNQKSHNAKPLFATLTNGFLFVTCLLIVCYKSKMTWLKAFINRAYKRFFVCYQHTFATRCFCIFTTCMLIVCYLFVANQNTGNANCLFMRYTACYPFVTRLLLVCYKLAI